MKKKLLILTSSFLIVIIATFTYCYATTTSPAPEETVTVNEIVPAITGKKDKVLIAYFTVPETDGVDAVAGASRIIIKDELLGNTQYVAQLIQEATGGDLFPIQTIEQYPGEHKALIEYAKKEIETNARPRLITNIHKLQEYDIIFVGFPNWWYDMPMPIYTFFDEHDFRGKTIIPFCTHGGSQFSDAIRTIAELEKNATIVKGLPVSRDNIARAKPTVLAWLKEIGMIE